LFLRFISGSYFDFLNLKVISNGIYIFKNSQRAEKGEVLIKQITGFIQVINRGVNINKYWDPPYRTIR